jgi:hypothetical protein
MYGKIHEMLLARNASAYTVPSSSARMASTSALRLDAPRERVETFVNRGGT